MSMLLLWMCVTWFICSSPPTGLTGSNRWEKNQFRSDRYPDLDSFIVPDHAPFYKCCAQLNCFHELDGSTLQLNPCSFYRECYCNIGGVDSNADFLFEGVLCGFKIVDSDADIPTYCLSNYSSIKRGKFLDEMHVNVSTELRQHKVSVTKVVPHCVHAIGAVEKKDGSLRPITDCRRPEMRSINNFMSTTALSFHFQTLDYVADIIRPGSFLAVVDISSAYRSVPIYPPHRKYHGFKWGDRYYTDNRLSFGLKCAPYIFTRISEFIVRTMDRYGFKDCVSYIDDFLCQGNTEQECRECQKFLVKLLEFLGFNVARHKLILPSQKVLYLGMYIDTINMEYSLPQHKLDKLGPLVDSFMGRDTATKLQLQSLAGVLSHCSYVVRGGRVFTRRITNLIKTLPNDSSLGRISDLMKSDLCWWKSFAVMFNGKARIIGCTPDSEVYFCTDASMSGFGATFGDDFLLGVWGFPDPELYDWASSAHWVHPPEFVSVGTDINELEMWPVLASVLRWGSSWNNKRVVLYTDNNQVLFAVNNNRSRNNNVMGWLREIFWASFVYNFFLTARRIPSVENVLPDCLSRFSVLSARRVGIELLKAGHFSYRNVAFSRRGGVFP